MTDRYADIIIDLSAEALDRTFQYRIPEDLREQIRPGSVVMIPFGRANRLVRGYVLQISGQPKFPPEKLKELSSIVTDQSSREDRLIALALWMRDYYGSTTLQALRTVLPMREQGPRKVRRTITGKSCSRTFTASPHRLSAINISPPRRRVPRRHRTIRAVRYAARRERKRSRTAPPSDTTIKRS